jgi:hypothetical protein
MHRNEPREPLAVRPIISAVFVIVGLGLFAFSFVWPGSSTRLARWSTDQALEYQAASANLHRLSHEFSRSAGTDKAQQVRAELHKAQSEFDVLRAELDSATARPKQIAMLLRFGGLALAAAGAADIYFRRAPGGA